MQNKTEQQMIEIEVDNEIINALEQRRIDPNEATTIYLPTVLRSLTTLENLKIVREITGKGRHKIFIYKEYLDSLSKGTEPLKNLTV